VLLLPLASLHAEPISLYEFGADDVAYLALPAEAPKAAVLLIPDAYSDAEVIANRCGLFSKLGFVALAIDLYGGEAGNPSILEPTLQERAKKNGPTIIGAALRLLHESPRYRAPRVILAVWGKNVPAAHQALLEHAPRTPLVALSWLDAPPFQTGSAEETILRAWKLPLQIVQAGETSGEGWHSLQKERTAQTSLFQYTAPAGFLYTESKTSVDAWTETIRFWNASCVAEPGALPAPKPLPDAKSPRKPIPPRLR
jgi:hypothetical protein